MSNFAGWQADGEHVSQVATQLHDQNNTARTEADDDTQREHEAAAAARRNQFLKLRKFVLRLFPIIVRMKNSQTIKKQFCTSWLGERAQLYV